MSRTDKKNEILQASGKIFAHYGYDKTTLDDIGKIVGLNKTSLYYYYKNKETIFTDVLQSELDNFLSVTMDKTEHVYGYANKIKVYMKELLVYSGNAANLIGLTNETMQAARPCIKSLTEDFMNTLIHYLSETIETGIQEGEFKECDSKEIARSIIRITNAVICKKSSSSVNDSTTENERNALEREVLLMISLVLDGLTKVSSRESHELES